MCSNQLSVVVHQITGPEDGVSESDIGLYRIDEAAMIVSDLNNASDPVLYPVPYVHQVVYKVCNMNWVEQAAKFKDNGRLMGVHTDTFCFTFRRDRNNPDIGYIPKYHFVGTDMTLVIQNPFVITHFLFYRLKRKYQLLPEVTATEYLDVEIPSEFENIMVEHPEYTLPSTNIELRFSDGSILDSA